jgi:protein-glutamine gamma-glutamyltransferase
MIVISDNEVRQEDIDTDYDENSVERKIISALTSSSEQYFYDSLDQLKFELKLRKEIIAASHELDQSKLKFAIFRKTQCNPAYWNRVADGGFVLKRKVKPSDAILDIFQNGSQYSTECATAMMIVYYKALLNVYSTSLFNKLFPKIELMNWHRIDKLLREVGLMKQRKDYLPGDRRYFKNPDVNPLRPQWQGENVIDLGNEFYYGHGIGIHKADTIIQALNKNRIEDADESAKLVDSAGRPDFKKLADVYQRANL